MIPAGDARIESALARLETEMRQVKLTQSEIKDSQAETARRLASLESVAAHGKGALAAILTLGGLATAFVSFLIDRLIGSNGT